LSFHLSSTKAVLDFAVPGWESAGRRTYTLADGDVSAAVMSKTVLLPFSIFQVAWCPAGKG
jgi:hypothetical protein